MTSNNTVRKARNFAAQELKAAERDQGAANAWAERDRPTAARRYFADGLTEFGRQGQCRGCGAWRTDGQPPTVHRTDCVYGPDGSQLAALYDPAAEAAIRNNAVNGALTPNRRTHRRR